jgi:predicted NodU family carbamoyl transferase
VGLVNKIIGFSAAHDSSVCIFENGKVLNFLKEERVTKKKRDLYPIKSLYQLDYQNEKVDLAYSTPTQDSTTYNATRHFVQKAFNLDNSFDYSDEHHLVHANLAFYDSGFSEALIFVIDRNGSIVGQSMRESETVYIASYPNNFKQIYKNFWVFDNSAHEYVSKLKKENPDCEFNASSN